MYMHNYYDVYSSSVANLEGKEVTKAS